MTEITEAVERGAKALFCHKEEWPLDNLNAPSVVFAFCSADERCIELANALRADARAVIEGSGLLSGLTRLQAEVEGLRHAVNVADNLIQTGYGVEVPDEWNDAFRAALQGQQS